MASVSATEQSRRAAPPAQPQRCPTPGECERALKVLEDAERDLCQAKDNLETAAGAQNILDAYGALHRAQARRAGCPVVTIRTVADLDAVIRTMEHAGNASDPDGFDLAVTAGGLLHIVPHDLDAEPRPFGYFAAAHWPGLARDALQKIVCDRMAELEVA